MKHTMRIILAMLLAAMLLTTAASAEGLTKVTMAFCTWTGYAPMFIAQANGYFEEAGLDMDIQVIEDESTYAALITTGNIDFLATAQDPNIKMYANGATSRYVLAMDASRGADGLVATADIATLDDLKGRTLALDKSASSYYFFLTALENGRQVWDAHGTYTQIFFRHPDLDAIQDAFHGLEEHFLQEDPAWPAALGLLRYHLYTVDEMEHVTVGTVF